MKSAAEISPATRSYLEPSMADLAMVSHRRSIIPGDKANQIRAALRAAGYTAREVIVRREVVRLALGKRMVRSNLDVRNRHDSSEAVEKIARKAANI